jgi:hypothetical protein
MNMSLTAVLMAAMLVLPVALLAFWARLVMTQVEHELRTLSGLERLRFDV